MQTKSIFAPAQNQSAVQHLTFTIEKITALPNGSLILGFRSGNIGSSLHVPNTPNRPEFTIGADYCVEFPKDSNPLGAPYTAIYPIEQKPKEKTMQPLLPAAINNLTITSREIAELTQKQHPHVMRDIRALQEALSMNPDLDSYIKSSTYTGKDGRKYEQYELDKDTCLTLLLGYDPVARMKVVKRWQELEAGNAAPAIPQNLSEALRLAADLVDEKNKLTQQVKALEVKEQALDRIATASSGSVCITNAAKLLNIPPKKMFTWLSSIGWTYRRAGGKSWLAYQDKIQRGVLEHKITTVTLGDGSEKITEQVLVTAKGLTELSEKLQAAQMAA